ncbi:transglycosylase family protein [Streptomyces sp. NPDC020742]|uniref:transglycosylase family protein n=1 Tax=unclassified Streptomyces TaxID=2593676 RepID=UPI0033ED21F7
MEFPQASETSARGAFRGYGSRGVTAAAVLLAAGALNVAAGQPAGAVASGTWDRLAGCESGGNWRIDSGNGFSGGLQLAHSTWSSFGGRSFGARAAHATRAQQIHVAERVLARQGWHAWPACSARLGLNGTPQGATPRSSTPQRAPQHTSRTPARPGHPHVHGKRFKAQRHRSSGGTVVVNAGDTVSGIAAAHGFRWQEFYRANRTAIGGNPDLIFPGTRLVLPVDDRG